MNSGGIGAIVRVAEREMGKESTPRYVLSIFDNILHAQVLLGDKRKIT